MKFQVRLTAKAERDVDETLAWFAEQTADEAAARWLAAMFAAVSRLERRPNQFPLIAEATDLGADLREVHFGRRQSVYRVIFQVAGRTVNVLHIRHAMRDAVRRDDLS